MSIYLSLFSFKLPNTSHPSLPAFTEAIHRLESTLYLDRSARGIIVVGTL